MNQKMNTKRGETKHEDTPRDEENHIILDVILLSYFYKPKHLILLLYFYKQTKFDIIILLLQANNM